MVEGHVEKEVIDSIVQWIKENIIRGDEAMAGFLFYGCLNLRIKTHLLKIRTEY